MALRAERQRRPALSRELVLRAATSVADAEGIGALSMRRLAAELKVEAMSLYHYFPSKDALLTGMVDAVMGQVEPPRSGREWKSQLRRSGISYHEALVRHPWANQTAPGPPGLAQLRYMDGVLRVLREAGLSPRLVHHAYHALESHIVGSTLWAAPIQALMKEKGDLAGVAQAFLKDVPMDEYPDVAAHVQQHLGGSMRGEKGVFEFGLDLILDGVERLHEAEKRPSSSRANGKTGARRSGSRRAR